MNHNPELKRPLILKKISFKNINVIFQDKSKFKYYNVWFEKMKCNIYSDRKQYEFEMKNRAIIKIMAFNTKKGSYLTEKNCPHNGNFFMIRLSKRISLQNQFVKINGQQYRLTGNFFLADEPHFNLNIETHNLLLKEAASIFPAKTRTQDRSIHFSKPLKIVKAQLSGPMKYLNFPLANVYFSVTDASWIFRRRALNIAALMVF